MFQLLGFIGLLALEAAFLTLPVTGFAQTGAARYEDDISGLSATLTPRPSNSQTGQPTTLRIALTDRQGQPVRDLLEHHARTFHVVIVSGDMRTFGHIHPEDFANPVTNGSAEVQFSFPHAGRYLVAADAMTEAGAFGAHFLLAVGDQAPVHEPVSSSASLAVATITADDVYTAPIEFDTPGSAEGYEASISRPGLLKAGRPATFTWRLTNGGKPITDMRLFLAAAMHLAVVKDDLSQFLHGHGVAKGIGTGYDHVHGAGAAADGAGTAPEIQYFGPEIVATVVFPEPGRYHLFGQAAHGDKMLITRFPVVVR